MEFLWVVFWGPVFGLSGPGGAPRDGSSRGQNGGVQGAKKCDPSQLKSPFPLPGLRQEDAKMLSKWASKSCPRGSKKPSKMRSSESYLGRSKGDLGMCRKSRPLPSKIAISTPKTPPKSPEKSSENRLLKRLENPSKMSPKMHGKIPSFYLLFGGVLEAEMTILDGRG